MVANQLCGLLKDSAVAQEPCLVLRLDLLQLLLLLLCSL